MEITPAHVLLPILCIVVGIVLIYVGLFGGWGLVWAVGGGFFITTWFMENSIVVSFW
jgi:hypothetical protein